MDNVTKGCELMGILWDLYNSTSKKPRCKQCGCIMEPDSENSICECCESDMNEDEEKEE